jgi:aspartate aminotransferase
MNALILCNRILGFVNAPALAQQILLNCLDEEIDLDIYRRRRQAMAEVLDAAGIEYQMPRGAFYFFPKVPVADEAKFFEAMTSECVLVVPGRSFGLAGHFRMTFCVDEDIIRRSGPGIARAVAKVRN